jgi:hypothetical protein
MLKNVVFHRLFLEKSLGRVRSFVLMFLKIVLMFLLIHPYVFIFS